MGGYRLCRYRNLEMGDGLSEISRMRGARIGRHRAGAFRRSPALCRERIAKDARAANRIRERKDAIRKIHERDRARWRAEAREGMGLVADFAAAAGYGSVGSRSRAKTGC